MTSFFHFIESIDHVYVLYFHFMIISERSCSHYRLQITSQIYSMVKYNQSLWMYYHYGCTTHTPSYAFVIFSWAN